jgi:hypothetical protein
MDAIPDWLIPANEPERTTNLPMTEKGNREALIALEKQDFEIAFETALESLADGIALSQFCAEYHTKLSPVRFRTWIFRDTRRKKLYEAAKAIGAEQVEDELIRISDGVKSDGTASMDDVARSTLRINTRKYLLQVWNRDKYGDVKRVDTRIDQTVRTVDQLTAAELNEKIIDVLGINPDEYFEE